MKRDSYVAGNNKGLTLIELLVSLIIMCFVFAVTFQLFHITKQSWLRAQAHTQSTHSASRAIQMIGHDIRSSQRPNASTLPAAVSATWSTGDTISIYRYNAPDYEAVRYRLNGSSLQRALVSSSTPLTSVDWNTATWKTIAGNVSAAGAGIFTDTSPPTTSVNSRRRIAVKLQVSAPSAGDAFSPCLIDNVYTTRSQVIEDQFAGSPSVIRVTGISVTPSQQTNLDDDGASFDASVSIYPIDATNKSISVATPSWLHCSVSGLNIHVTVDAQASNAGARNGTITIISDDTYNRSAAITCKQKAESFF